MERLLARFETLTLFLPLPASVFLLLYYFDLLLFLKLEFLLHLSDLDVLCPSILVSSISPVKTLHCLFSLAFIFLMALVHLIAILAFSLFLPILLDRLVAQRALRVLALRDRPMASDGFLLFESIMKEHELGMALGKTIH